MLTTSGRSRSEVFCKKGFLKDFAKFTGKHLRQGLFLIKVAGLRPDQLACLIFIIFIIGFKSSILHKLKNT